MREDHVQSAVTFLREPQVASAPMAKKVEFLESKSLTSEEISEALNRVQESTSSSQSGSSQAGGDLITDYSPPRPSYMVQQPPLVPERDWKDYFVMATVSVGVAYGLYACAKRYVLPMIMPPTPASLEADKEALEAEFQRTEDLIKQLQEDTAELRKLEETRSAEFDKVMAEARDVINSIKSQSEERKQESKLALSNVEVLRELIPRSLQKHSETQAQAVNELQNELKSLKQLMSRNKSQGVPIPPASAVPSSLPGFPRRKKDSSLVPDLKIVNAKAPEVGKGDPVSGGDSKTDEAQPEDNAPNQSAGQPSESTSDTFIPDPQAGIPEWQKAAAK